MTSALLSWAPPARITDGINRWFDAVQGGRALWVFLALFVAIWTSFQIVSYASIGLHVDLAEAFSWSRSSLRDTSPPLIAFVAAGWFSIFPVADWSFHLLAMVNVAVAFFAIDLIARRYVSGDKRLLVLLLLLLTPFYQFHGQRFNANAILLSTWPIATYCFLRSFESRSLAWSAAAGAAAADAREILFGPAGRRVRRRGARAPPAARLSAIGGAVGIGRGGSCCAGAASALVTTGGETMIYAYQRHLNVPMSGLLWALVPYVIGGIGYISAC